MKFAKELEQELVPEWRVKYLDYKTGKKHVKAVARAINRAANATPSIRRSGELLPPRGTPSLFAASSPFAKARRGSTATTAAAPGNASLYSGGGGGGSGGDDHTSLRSSPAPFGRTVSAASPAQKQQQQDDDTPPERQSLTYSPRHRPAHYGSIVSASAGGAAAHMRNPSAATATTFELPGPALRMPSNVTAAERPGTGGGDTVAATRRKSVAFGAGLDELPEAASAAAAATTKTSPPARPGARRSLSMTVPVFRAIAGRHAVDEGHDDGHNDVSGGGAASIRSHAAARLRGWGPPQRLRRIFSAAPAAASLRGGGGGGVAAGDGKDDIDMRPFDEVREREQAFFAFLDGELDKVEGFYRLKEEQAGQRLALLREQLHVMRSRRIEEIQQARRHGAASASASAAAATAKSTAVDAADEDDDGGPADGRVWDVRRGEWMAPLRAKLFKPGPNSKALQKMPQTPRMEAPGGGPGEGGPGEGGPGRVFSSGVIAADARHRDYTRRAGDADIPYRTAKRKLKLALQEFYRGLELLKAYALLNRTAFRKLNKKYDKAVNARPPYRYMSERVNQAWFVNSGAVDELIVAAEDLYARYFEGGNHKVAAGKLRALMKRPGDASASTFRNGLMLGVGAVFAIEGVVAGARLLLHAPDPVLRTQTGYLLQIYGGYFLMLYLFGLFCLDCRLWAANKINYPFIFEFDPRSHLDWRELAQFPCFFLLLFGLVLWLNFSAAANTALFLYYPVLLIGLTALLLFFPYPTLWHRSRKWFLYSHWRLFFGGLYPVEFRDFFLGDMYCSLTYATSNIELFFCLYAHHWTNPGQCNSSHSRLLGFFSTLPPIWRALQCLRRFRDTGNVFPHLVNCGKYAMTIVSAVCLSLYRIEGSHSNLALFIAFSTLNGVYTSFWDLFMDFSLLQASSRHALLRDILALKTRWPYYAIMALDPVLRFSWIFYAIFTHDTQHNSVCSFFVAFAEVTRRGMWTLLRVENEHCANVAQYKASRDVPLPYHLHAAAAAAAAADEEEEDDPPKRKRAASTQPRPGAPPAFFLGNAVDEAPEQAASTTTAAAEGGAPPPSSAAGQPGASSMGSPPPSSMASTAVPGRPGTAISAAGTAGTAVDGGASSSAAAAAADVRAAEEGTAGFATGTSVAGTPPLEPGATSTGGSVLRRRLTTTLGSAARKSIAVMLAEAHKQDFEKKRRPSAASGSGAGGVGAVAADSMLGETNTAHSATSSPLLSAGAAGGLDEGGSSDDEGAAYEEAELAAAAAGVADAAAADLEAGRGGHDDSSSSSSGV